MGKALGDYQHWREQTEVKKHKKGRMKFKRNYMKLISGGMVGNSNYIGKSLNRLILYLTSKDLNPFLFLKEK